MSNVSNATSSPERLVTAPEAHHGTDNYNKAVAFLLQNLILGFANQVQNITKLIRDSTDKLLQVPQHFPLPMTYVLGFLIIGQTYLIFVAVSKLQSLSLEYFPLDPIEISARDGPGLPSGVAKQSLFLTFNLISGSDTQPRIYSPYTTVHRIYPAIVRTIQKLRIKRSSVMLRSRRIRVESGRRHGCKFCKKKVKRITDLFKNKHFTDTEVSTVLTFLTTTVLT